MCSSGCSWSTTTSSQHQWSSKLNHCPRAEGLSSGVAHRTGCWWMITSQLSLSRKSSLPLYPQSQCVPVMIWVFSKWFKPLPRMWTLLIIQSSQCSSRSSEYPGISRAPQFQLFQQAVGNQLYPLVEVNSIHIHLYGALNKKRFLTNNVNNINLYRKCSFLHYCVKG